ncbi:hypothetical protein L0B53_16580 [Vibrio sp. SS-MA-C1-2]|uniref:hypothetical protein n=1 Tax=Vibrio sp. SS-MA-C1-2 TaxID=2908646 RepID=UPI001F15D93A|nr:hypothetical protein [Vibrio sp. SS-MA-C1-2]UJF18606.1 hypothetical protein L0B53_16580 [Vibrio sp. SS-MA-C1-2]
MKNKYIITLIFIGLLSGCASNESANQSAQPQTNLELSRFDSLQTRLNSVTDSYSESDLAWYANKNYKAMTSAVNDALDAYSEFELEPNKINDSGFFSSKTYGEQVEEALNNYDIAFQQAKITKARVKSVLSVAFDNRQYLYSTNAAHYYPTEARNVELALKKVVDYVAVTKTKEIDPQRIKNLEQQQHNLEVKAVTANYLGTAISQYNKQKSRRYNKDTPIVSAKAGTLLSQAESFVETHPRDYIEIENKARLVNFALQRADVMTKQVRELANLSDDQLENYLLKLETSLYQISTATGVGDHRDQRLTDQAGIIIHALTEKNGELASDVHQLNQQLDNNKQKLILTGQQIDTLQHENKSLRYQLQQAGIDLPEASTLKPHVAPTAEDDHVQRDQSSVEERSTKPDDNLQKATENTQH